MNIKYYMNKNEPEAVEWAEKMRLARINFSSVPTSGSLTLWIDGIAFHGPTNVYAAIEKLIEKRKL